MAVSMIEAGFVGGILASQPGFGARRDGMWLVLEVTVCVCVCVLPIFLYVD